MKTFLDGCVVLVTGGARGIGAHICRVLTDHGARVAINYHASEERARTLADEIGGIAVQGDVRDPDEARAMVDATLNAFGRIDGLVNNALAGEGRFPFGDATPQDYQTAFDYGCHAVVNMVAAVRPHFRAQGSGRIVNIVTELWNFAPPGWTVYLAGTGALVGVSRSLAKELGPEGITVNMISPGWMRDERVDPDSEGSLAYAQGVPLRRHGSADEIGYGCVFFMSHLSGYVSGAALPINGGGIAQMGG